MRRGFSAGNLLLSAFCLSLASPTLAEEKPKPKPVTEVITEEEITEEAVTEKVEEIVAEIEEVELAPLPVPRPVQVETVETEAGTGIVAFVSAEPAPAGKGAVVTATSGARAPAEPDPLGELRQLVAQEAEVNGVAAALADAVVNVESRYDPAARGDAGEIGLMQIKPETARQLGFRGPDYALFHPATNVRWGMMYLAQAQRRGGGTVCGTILKYNAGHGAEAMNPVSALYCNKVKALLRDEPA